MDSLPHQVLATCRKYSLIPRGGHVLAAVSGGPDSTALLHILGRLCPYFHARMTVAHFHHGIRGADADEDARFVGRLAEEMNLPFVLERGDAPAYRKRYRLSLQEAARVLRHEFLERTRKTLGADCTALGHTRDDQVEELMLRFLRGVGPDGLAGMQVSSQPALVRPLLFTPKKELLSYLRDHGLPFRIDPSNRDVKYLRNRVREQIMPLLRAVNPRFEEAAERLTIMASRDKEYFVRQTVKLWPQVVIYESQWVVILDRPFLAGLHPSLASRLVRRALTLVAGTAFSSAANHIDSILDAVLHAEESVHLDLPRQVNVEVGQGEVAIVQRDFIGYQPPVRIDGPGTVALEEIGAMIDVLTSRVPEDPRRDPWCGLVDADRVSWPVVVRTFTPGDRMTPLGMQGTKKLKEVFIDRNIPRWKRRALPLIESRGEVVWVSGVGPSEKVRISGASTDALEIRCRGWMVPCPGRRISG